MQLRAVILAAGQGTRMKSALPKVLHPLLGKPLVAYSVETATAVTGATPVLVVGHGSEQVRAALDGRVEFALQAQQLGTGHAVLSARTLLEGRADAVLVTYGDMPLLTEKTLRQMVAGQMQNKGAMTMLTVIADDPRGFGRVIRDSEGRVQEVVEEAQCTPEQLAIRELNAGVYCFDAKWLWQTLPQLPLSPKGEYYLTDTVGMAVRQGHSVTAIVSDDETELLGINTRVHLAEAEQAMRARINRRWMEAGVTFIDPATSYIDDTVTIGRDTVILPNTFLWGNTTVGAHCRIGPGSALRDSRVGDGCMVTWSVLEEVELDAGSQVGPYHHLSPRPGDVRAIELKVVRAEE